MQPFGCIIVAMDEDANNDNVIFIATSDNTKRVRVFQDVDFSSITSLITKIARE